MHTVTCAGCGEAFEAKTSRAKWCSAACRKRHQRSAAADAPAPDASAAVGDAPAHDEHDEHALVAMTRRELERVGRVETFAGQLALQLAKRLASPDESGVSALSKELRTVMAAALEGVTPPPADDSGAEPVEPEDEVEKARRKREEARQAAGLS